MSVSSHGRQRSCLVSPPSLFYSSMHHRARHERPYCRSRHHEKPHPSAPRERPRFATQQHKKKAAWLNLSSSSIVEKVSPSIDRSINQSIIPLSLPSPSSPSPSPSSSSTSSSIAALIIPVTCCAAPAPPPAEPACPNPPKLTPPPACRADARLLPASLDPPTTKSGRTGVIVRPGTAGGLPHGRSDCGNDQGVVLADGAEEHRMVLPPACHEAPLGKEEGWLQ